MWPNERTDFVYREDTFRFKYQYLRSETQDNRMFVQNFDNILTIFGQYLENSSSIHTIFGQYLDNILTIIGHYLNNVWTICG